MKKPVRFPYALLITGMMITLLAAAFAPAGTVQAQSREAPVLGAPTPLSPNGAIKETKPAYRWTRIPGAAYYQIQVLKEYSSAVVYSYTVSATTYCSTSTCSFTPLVKLASFGYRWQVKVNGSSTSWSPLLKFYVRGESFSNHFTYGLMYWWTRKSGGDWYAQYNGGVSGYLVSHGLPDKCSAAVHYTSSTYDNFVAETRIKVTGAPSGGQYPEAYLALRMKNSVDAASQCWYGGYLFGYSLDGKYSFWKMDNTGKWVTIIPPTYSSKIKKTDWNNFKVNAVGNTFYLYINNAYIGNIIDNSYGIGYVGFEMVNHGSAPTTFYANWLTVNVTP